jgi:hypothetical protein
MVGRWAALLGGRVIEAEEQKSDFGVLVDAVFRGMCI